jgi:hypothetical protein
MEAVASSETFGANLENCSDLTHVLMKNAATLNISYWNYKTTESKLQSDMKLVIHTITWPTCSNLVVLPVTAQNFIPVT